MLVALVLLEFATFPWLYRLIRQAGQADLAPMTAFSIPPSLAALTASLVGVVLALRRPRPVGWLLLTLACAWAQAEGPRAMCPTHWWSAPGRCRPPTSSPGCIPL